MEISWIALALITLFYILFLFKFLINKTHGSKNLPKGSLGLPLIGETISFYRALKNNQATDWVNKRVAKHGPIFKTSIAGNPTVFILGLAGNKFVLGSSEDVFSTSRSEKIGALHGKDSLFEVSGSRYKLIKRAMLSFLRPESLQSYVKLMDDLVTTSLLREIKEKDTTIKTLDFMKKLTFNVACEILFDIHDEATKEAFLDDFHLLFKALGSLPINFPGSAYSKGMQAKARIDNRFFPILKKKKEGLFTGVLSPTHDVVSCLLALRDENGEPISDQAVADNFRLLIIASHDTTAIFLSLMIWKLSREKEIYNKVLKEQMDILRNKEAAGEERLTWVDIQKMKYTWQVAQELMRMIPPVDGTARKTIKDTNFGGYDIPKGWQVFIRSQETHMEKDIFSNPMEFDPSRFDKSSKPITPYAYIAFGAGLHSCIGNEFSRIEALTTLHRLITKFEWSQVYPDETISRRTMAYPTMGLPIKIQPKVLP